MIPDVDESLRALLRRDAVDGADVEISFEAPTKDWSTRRQGPTLSVYLYDIREDLERRTRQPEQHRDERGVVVGRRLPPRYFKLSYLVTAWTQRPEDDHRLLAVVLAPLLRSDALPPEILQGTLEDVTDPVKVTVALPPPKDRALSDVWTALGGELKPSLDVVVSAPFQPDQTRAFGPPVLEEPRIRMSRHDAQGGPETAGGRRRYELDDPEAAAPDDERTPGERARSRRKSAARPAERRR
jgi:hypothetical protein